MVDVSAPLLDVSNLTIRFDTAAGEVHAATGITYAVKPGETLGIVGESGSGKTVHVLSMLQLLPKPPCRIVSGAAMFRGQDLLNLPIAELARIRGHRIGMIFQDPMTSLNPTLRIGRQISEVIEEHLGLSRRDARRRAVELLDMVRIPQAARLVDHYPHEFSGGMRQRVMIAIALACQPRLLIADEPTTALDVTVQREIVELVRELKQTLDMAVIWITHDLGVVAAIADTIQVMYAGRILERGPVDSIFDDPRNAYTLGLLQSSPYRAASNRDGRRLRPIEGAPPDLLNLPAGDPFAPRNRHATPRCFKEMPPLLPAPGGAPDHLVAAWYDLRQFRDEWGGFDARSS
jgi:peptide/nickel transport system ATP-binding protein/oligopeptide transport system ATP-binding protein